MLLFYIVVATEISYDIRKSCRNRNPGLLLLWLPLSLIAGVAAERVKKQLECVLQRLNSTKRLKMVNLLVWSTVILSISLEIHIDAEGTSESDTYHAIWEREARQSANRVRTMEGLASSVNHRVENVKAYYRAILESDEIGEAADDYQTTGVNPDITSEEWVYDEVGYSGRNYWVDPAPPFNPKPVHVAPSKTETTSTNTATQQVRIPARYMIMFQERATKDHVTRTVDAMKEITELSGRRIRAADFTTYEHVSLGFAATLNNPALIAVSANCIFSPC